MSRGRHTRRVAEWRRARARHYARTRSPEALAVMIVELEDKGGFEPEFALDEQWPEDSGSC